MRPYPGNPAFVFATGDGGALIESYPQVSYSTEELVNTAIAKNGKGISEVVFAPRSHPLSPWRLGRKASDGTLVPRYLLGDPIEDHTIRTKAEARAVAASRIADSLMTSVECAAESLPIPHLDPADLLEFRTDEFVVNVRLRQATLPLTVGSTMSLGWLKRSTVNTKRIRRP